MRGYIAKGVLPENQCLIVLHQVSVDRVTARTELAGRDKALGGPGRSSYLPIPNPHTPMPAKFHRLLDPTRARRGRVCGYRWPISQLSGTGVTLHATRRAGCGMEPVAVLVSAPAGLEVGCTVVQDPLLASLGQEDMTE